MVANQKLTDRTQLTEAADGDKIHIVDVSDTTDSPQGTSKFIEKSDLVDTSFLGLTDVYETTYQEKEGLVPMVTVLNTEPATVGLKFQALPNYSDLLGGNAIINGGVQHISDLTYRVYASKYIVNNIVYNDFVSDTITLNNGDPTNDRFDSIVVDVTPGEPATITIAVVEGTPAASPLKPTINLLTQAEISFVQVDANATSDNRATSETIYDENADEPTEWDNTLLQIGGDLDYTTDPFTGTKCAQFAATASGTTKWQKDAMYNFDSAESIVFAMKSSTLSEQRSSIEIQLINSVSTEYYSINLTLSNISQYGFNQYLTTWQVLQIPLSDFVSQFSPIEYDTISFKFVNTPELFLDFVGVQGGVNSEPPTGGGGDVFKVGTPVNNQLAVWTGDGTLEGSPDFTITDEVLMLLDINKRFIIRDKDDASTQMEFFSFSDVEKDPNDAGDDIYQGIKFYEDPNNGTNSVIGPGTQGFTVSSNDSIKIYSNDIIELKTVGSDGTIKLVGDTKTLVITNQTIADIDSFSVPGLSPLVTKEWAEENIKRVGYTVATLPSGTLGDTAYVTDATAPTYLGTLTGGGGVACPVWHNGTAWVSN